MSRGSIYIFGVPRSGTTWLAKIFDSHPQSLLRHEPDTVNSTTAIPFIMSADEIDRHLDKARDYIQARQHDRQLRCVSSSPYFYKSFRNRVTDAARRAMIATGRGLDLACGGRLDRRLLIPDLVNPGSSPIHVVKSVDSCGRLPLFARACPEDRFVFIVRNPCGVIASKFRGREIGKMNPAVTFKKMLDLDSARDHGLTIADLENWSTLEADAWTWMLTHDFIFRCTQGLDNVRVLNYDQLCESPLAQARELLTWSGLDWSTQTQDYINECMGMAPDARPGFYSTQQNPQQAANKWRSQLSTDEVAQIKAICTKSDAGQLFSYEQA